MVQATIPAQPKTPDRSTRLIKKHKQSSKDWVKTNQKKKMCTGNVLQEGIGGPLFSFFVRWVV